MKESMSEEEWVWERWQEASPIYSTRSHSYTSNRLNSYSAHMKLWAYRARLNTSQLSVWQTWTMSKLDCNFNELSLSIHTVTDLWSLLRALLCSFGKSFDLSAFLCLCIRGVIEWSATILHNYSDPQWTWWQLTAFYSCLISSKHHVNKSTTKKGRKFVSFVVGVSLKSSHLHG